MSKIEADRLLKLTVISLRKWGYFKEGTHTGTVKWTRSGFESMANVVSYIGESDKSLQLTYTRPRADNRDMVMQYNVPLTTTLCHYGGVRYWFICPVYHKLQYCGRRVGVLYLGDDYFACRHCYNLTYASRNAGGRYKGFVSIPDLEAMEDKVKRTHYAGKPTRKYRRLLQMEERFETGIIGLAKQLGVSKKK
ncbi:MAG TPA: hypothetical protein VMR46_03855 [Candidatus Paceibacterota bacterium]|nr:hypothetical protein [Candidatus Paceibacterota bacterium]